MTSTELLFVYGTLQRGHDHPIAHALAAAATWVSRGHVAGRLYRIDSYPGLIPDIAAGPVHGDLFRMADPATLLPLLDGYEECSADFPTPREYRRESVSLSSADGPVTAWTYVYAWPVKAAALIADGRFTG